MKPTSAIPQQTVSSPLPSFPRRNKEPAYLQRSVWKVTATYGPLVAPYTKGCRTLIGKYYGYSLGVPQPALSRKDVGQSLQRKCCS